jgi:hypothetical protein
MYFSEFALYGVSDIIAQHNVIKGGNMDKKELAYQISDAFQQNLLSDTANLHQFITLSSNTNFTTGAFSASCSDKKPNLYNFDTLMQQSLALILKLTNF